MPRGVGNLYEGGLSDWQGNADGRRMGPWRCPVGNLGESLECVSGVESLQWSSVVGAGAGAWVCCAWVRALGWRAFLSAVEG